MYVLTCFYFRLYPLVDENRLTEFTTGATFPLVQFTGTEFQITFPVRKKTCRRKIKTFQLVGQTTQLLGGNFLQVA